MFFRTGLILAVTLISLVALLGQEKDLTQADRLVVDNPEVINLELTPITKRRRADVYEKLSGPYKAGSKIFFNLVGTNTSTLPLIVRGWDTFTQNRPLLSRNGQEVPYRAGLEDIVKRKDKELGIEVIHLVSTRLEPGQSSVIEQIDLASWYDPLLAGNYELSLKHRFVQAGKWVDARSVTFEVVAEAK